MPAITFRNGPFIMHNNATYIPSPLIPGFTGHLPTTKFLCGDTFGKASMKYLQDIRSASMGCHASEHKGGMFPCMYSSNRAPITMNHQKNKYPALHLAYGARYNVDFKRQEEIKLFNQLAQKVRENYKDKTGTRHPASFSIMPEMEKKKYL